MMMPVRHQTAGFGNRVDAQNLVQIADGQNAQQRQTNPAAAAHQAGSANDHHRDGHQFIAHAGFRIALLFLGRLADPRHGGEHARSDIGQCLCRHDRNARKPRSFFVAANRIKIPAPAMF